MLHVRIGAKPFSLCRRLRLRWPRPWSSFASRAFAPQPPWMPKGEMTGTATSAAPQALPEEIDYEGAERVLSSELESRRSAMPAKETTVFEDSLRIVDEAIHSTRSALASHPEDLELRAELDRVWQDKLELLREAIELQTEM